MTEIKTPVYSNHGPTQALFEAAYRMSRRDTVDGLNELERAVSHCLAQIEKVGEFGDIAALARDEYQTDDIEVDDNPLLSVGDDGVWVQSWVHVSNASLKGELG